MQNNDGSQKISGKELKDLYKSFVSEYPIVSIEDPFDQDDWEHYALMTSEIGEKVQIVGDDLLVTNPKVRMDFTKNSFMVCNNRFFFFFIIVDSNTFSIMFAESWEGNQGEILQRTSFEGPSLQHTYLFDGVLIICSGPAINVSHFITCFGNRLIKLDL